MKPRIFNLILLLIMTCSLGTAFAIINRKAGDPVEGAKGPDLVLRIMEVAVNQNSFDDYRSVLSDSFMYIPDIGTVEMYPNIDWANWNISMEEGFIAWLTSPVIKGQLNLTERITERGMPYDQEATYEITYMVKVQGKSFIGGGRFVFEEIEQNWLLKRWEEILPITDEISGGFYTNSGLVRASMVRR